MNDTPKPFEAGSNGNGGPQKVTAADGHTYHKSATANAPVAPTNATTVKNATKQGSLTSDELDFVTIVHYHYSLTGFPTFEFLSENYDYTEAEITALFSSTAIRDALSERGVEFTSALLAGLDNDEVVNAALIKAPLPSSKHRPKLSPIQLVVANKLLDVSDTRSERKKLQDCGVTTTKFQSWMKNPDFAGYLRDRAEGMLGEYQHEAMLSLVDQVRSGNMKAIQYMHEITGRYVTQAAKNSGGGQINYQVLLVRLIEIIEEEIDDNATAVRIGERIRGLVSAGQVAGMLELPTHEVTQPEIAKAREQTPEVKAMMAKGLGYQQ